MMRRMLGGLGFLVVMVGCGPVTGGSSGGGTGGGNTNPVPNFHGQFTVDRTWHQESVNPDQDKVEKFTLDLQASRGDSDGWAITGTAAIQTVTFTLAGSCMYTATGSQVVEGSMSDPTSTSRSTRFTDGFVDWSILGKGTVSVSSTKLGANYACTPFQFWTANLTTSEGNESTCTVTERDSAYNNNAGFDLKIKYSCTSTSDASGYPITETETGELSGAWVPN